MVIIITMVKLMMSLMTDGDDSNNDEGNDVVCHRWQRPWSWLRGTARISLSSFGSIFDQLLTINLYNLRTSCSSSLAVPGNIKFSQDLIRLCVI